MKILDLDLDLTFDITRDFGSTISTIKPVESIAIDFSLPFILKHVITNMEIYGHISLVQKASIIHCTQVYNNNDQFDFYKTDIENQYNSITCIYL